MKSKAKILLLNLFIVVFGVLSNLGAQTKQGKYLVIFKDKSGTTFSIDKPLEFLSQRAIDRRKKQNIAITAHDLPPNKTYLNELEKAGGKVWYKSRWYNAALVLADSATALKIKALPFVKAFENNGPLDLDGIGQLRRQSKFEVDLDTVNHGSGTVQARMLGTQNLHNAGYKGEGYIIAVLDDGFNRIDKNTYLAHLFDQKKIVGTFDFVRNKPTVYDIGGHGNLVLSTMASNINAKFVGTAPEASYLLLRTEDAPTEKMVEEANYLFAAEYADSVGVDVINTSLGYEDFDYPAYTHSRQDFDGDKTLVTKAADWAAAAGILVCVSAGNSGEAGIAAPADGDSVLTIGSVDRNEIRSGFSSVGPTSDGRIKPDLSAMGTSSTLSTGDSQLVTGNGTSFSSPIFAGFAACFWQANPEMKMMDVYSALKKLGTQAQKPDNRLGYGIPKYGKVLILANEKEIDESAKIFPNPTADQLNIKIPQSWANNKFILEINNLVGQNIIKETNLTGNQEIDIWILPEGFYYARIISEKEELVFKFIKY